MKPQLLNIIKRPAILIGIGALMAFARPVQGIPALQLYVEGSTYDSATETWMSSFSSGDTIRLWAIGNVDGPGGKGTISNVKLSVAYDIADAGAIGINIASSTTGGYGGYTDPSTPGAAVFSQTKTDGSTPKLSDGKDLASHGVYGAGTAWTEFALGNFDKKDSQIGDFINSFPSAAGGLAGQINVYEITITGANAVHFDLYDSYQSKQGAVAVFAPFSHDAEGNNRVPDGGATLAMLGAGLIALSSMRRFVWR